jgi:hypothetical protein
MKETLLQIPGEICKVEAKRNGAILLTMRSQEDIPPEVRARAMEYHEKFGWFCFLPSTEQIRAEDILDLDLPKLETTEKKTQSERLRAVLYRLWEQDGKPNKTAQKTEAMAFEVHYRDAMETLIEHYKKRLN